MELAFFRNTVRNRRYLQRELSKKRSELDNIYYRLSGVKGVNPNKEVGTTNHEVIVDARHDMMERIEKIKKDITRIELEIEFIDRITKQIDPYVLKMITELFIEGRTYNTVATRHHISVNQLQYMIETEVSKI